MPILESPEEKVSRKRRTTFFIMLNIAMLSALLIVYALDVSTLASKLLCIGVLVSQIFSFIFIWKINDAVFKPIHGESRDWYKILNRVINKLSILITLLAAISLVVIAFFDLSLLQYGLIAIVGAQTITFITSFILFCYKKIQVHIANLTPEDFEKEPKLSKNMKMLDNFFYITLAQSIACLLLGLTIALKFFYPTPIDFLTSEVTAYIVGACSAILLSCTMIYFNFAHSTNPEQTGQQEQVSQQSQYGQDRESENSLNDRHQDEIDAALSAALSASLGANSTPSTIVSSSESSETTDSSLRPGTHKG